MWLRSPRGLFPIEWSDWVSEDGKDLSRDLKEMSMEVGWGSPSTQPQTGMWLACAGIERNKALAQREFGERREKSWVESETRLWLLPLDSRVRGIYPECRQKPEHWPLNCSKHRKGLKLLASYPSRYLESGREWGPLGVWVGLSENRRPPQPPAHPSQTQTIRQSWRQPPGCGTMLDPQAHRLPSSPKSDSEHLYSSLMHSALACWPHQRQEPLSGSITRRTERTCDRSTNNSGREAAHGQPHPRSNQPTSADGPVAHVAWFAGAAVPLDSVGTDGILIAIVLPAAAVVVLCLQGRKERHLFRSWNLWHWKR